MSTNSKQRAVFDETLQTLGFSEAEMAKFMKILAVVNAEELNPSQETGRLIEEIITSEGC